MRIAHVGDIHIGAGRKWFSDLQSEKPYYLERHRVMLHEMAKKIAEAKVDHIILAGDLLDHAKPFANELIILAEWLNLLAEVTDTYIIAGNHEDLFGNVTALHPVAAMMSHPKLHWCLDFQVNKAPWGKTLWASHKDTHKISAALEADKDIEFVVAHYAAKGCIYENNTMAPKGWVFDYKPEKVKQWFLGDIHMRQNVSPNAAYPGSPCQLNFGESGQKGIDIYDVDKGKRERILLSAAPPLMTVSIKDKVPKFLENALYRVYASKKFIDYSFPPNVVSVQLFEAKKDDKKTKKVESENIDFGNPLDGLEEVLIRYELDKSLIVKATEEAKAIVT